MPAKTDVLRVRLVADGAGKVRADMLGVEDSFKRVDKTQSKLAIGLKTLGGLFTVISAGAIAAATKTAISFADGIDKAAERTGFGVEALQELRFAAEQVGVSNQQLEDGLSRLTRRIGLFAQDGAGPAAKAFEQLGINIRTASGAVRSSEAIFGDAVAALEGVSSEAERAALASQLFGEDAGPRLRLLLDQGVIGLQNLRQEAQDIGAVLSDDVIETAVEAQDSLSKLSRVLRVQFTTALAALIPIITKASDAFVTFVGNVRQFFNLSTGNAIKDIENEIERLTNRLDHLNTRKQSALSAFIPGERGRLQDEIKETTNRINTLNKALEWLNSQSDEQPLSNLGAEQSAKDLKETEKQLNAILDRLNPLQARAKQFNTELAVLKRELTGADLAEAVRKLEAEFAAATGGNRELNKTLKKTDEEIKEVGKAAENELQEPFTRAAENIQREFGNIFSDIVRNGEIRFETFTDALRDLFSRLAGEIAALLVFKPQLLGGGLGGITSGLGLFGASGTAAAGGAGGAATSGTLGGFLASGLTGTSPLITVGFGIGAGLVGTLAGNAISEAIGLNASRYGNVGGGLGAIGGAYLGLALGGPAGLILGAGLGGLGGSVIGNLFGGGGNNKQKIGITTTAGPGGVETPFGNIQITREQNIDAGAVVRSLAQIDETLAQLLSPEQIETVRNSLIGKGQFFSAKSFDNEAFDIVRVRLGRIVDAVAGNEIASQLLDRIPRGEQNVDQLVAEAQRILQLIQLFDDEGGELNAAEQAIQALNQQFDQLAAAAKDLGFSLEEVESSREQELQKLVQDFDLSIRDQILAITDPLRFALEQQEKIAKERLENAESLGADIVEVERLNALERRKILESQFDASNKTIENFLNQLSTGSLGGLTSAQRLSNTQGLFNRLLGDARTDPAARAELAQLLPTLVDLTRQRLGSSAEFFEFTDSLERTLRNLVDTDSTVDTLTDIGSAITAGDNAIVDTLKEEIGELRSTVVALNADIALLLNAPQAA